MLGTGLPVLFATPSGVWGAGEGGDSVGGCAGPSNGACGRTRGIRLRFGSSVGLAGLLAGPWHPRGRWDS
jgi:hypothetical protein